MSEFPFNPETKSYPLFETATSFNALSVGRPIKWRLWRLELIYVYSLGKGIILEDEKEQSCFRKAYAQFASAIEEQAIQTFHELGFFRDLAWIPIRHDMEKKQPVDGWFQYEYILDLEPGTERNYVVID